jgi:ornithine carbamoyltransferase
LAPSTSGLAVLSMPIMAPLSDFAGVSRDLAVTAFQTAIGITNLAAPTYAVVVGGLAIGRVEPYKKVVNAASSETKETGARILLTEDVQQGVSECDFVYTDVWVSIGEHEDVWAERIKLLMPYQDNTEAMAMTGNPYVKFMHCLPAFHNSDTEVGQHIRKTFGLDAIAVTDDAFEPHASIVFDQAKNRMHTIKAVLVATLES